MAEASKPPRYVYHGSKEPFDMAIPKRQVRGKKNAEGILQVTFDQISFHATLHRWIALAYTHDWKTIPGTDGKYFSMGVDLYEYTPEIEIFGIGSLEKSLQELYGAGGYLMGFDEKDFHHTQGLGNLEVISTTPIKPVFIERIDDPVAEMRAAGVQFRFTNILEKS